MGRSSDVTREVFVSRGKTPEHGVTLKQTESRSYLITVFTARRASLKRFKTFSTACFFSDLMERAVLL